MEIIRIKKEGGRYVLHLSNNDALSLKESVFVRHNLYKGKEIDRDQIAAIVFDGERQDGIDLALKKLTNRKTENEIRTLLSSENFDEEIIDEVLDYLIEYGFVDDEAYALLFCRDKRNINGYGPVKIAYILRQKGIDDSTIAHGLEEYTADMEQSMIASIVEKKYLRDGILIKERNKIIRFLLSRGFHYSEIKEVLNRWKN